MTSASARTNPIRGVEEEQWNGFRLFTVKDPNALTQLVGWLRFGRPGEQVVLRGQARLHADMVPSGLRPTMKWGPRAVHDALSSLVTDLFGSSCGCRGGQSLKWGEQHQCLGRIASKTDPAFTPHSLVSGTQRAAVEPLLQHFGIATRWLDVVDNVWIALWFACHSQLGTSQYAFHLRRSIGQEGAGAKAYVAVMRSGVPKATEIPGYVVSDVARLVDLRYAVPSVYLRPHAQHGLLIAPRNLDSNLRGSLRDLVVGYIQVALDDALDWLGTGAMLSTHVLFPPAAVDEGYRRLLESGVLVPPELGAITAFGPGY